MRRCESPGCESDAAPKRKRCWGCIKRAQRSDKTKAERARKVDEKKRRHTEALRALLEAATDYAEMRTDELADDDFASAMRGLERAALRYAAAHRPAVSTPPSGVDNACESATAPPIVAQQDSPAGFTDDAA